MRGGRHQCRGPLGHNVRMGTTNSATEPRQSKPPNAEIGDGFVGTLSASGYTDIRVIRAQVCAVKTFNYTTALIVGLSELGYERRYCYEHRLEAQATLETRDGQKHPSGPWIKCKGAGIDLVNPDFN